MFINQILTKLKSLVYSKSEIDSLLNGKASSSHTHTKSQITDFPTIPSKTSDLTNDSGFISSAIKEVSIGDVNSWCLLHGDLLIQWGTNSNISNDFTTNFSKAFSVVPVVVANYGDNVSFDTPCAVDDIFKTAFIVKHSNSGAWRVNWIAIGRA